MSRKQTRKPRGAGKLRIGDDWNAINIIALSQANPLKSVSEFVENSIDAGARRILVTRGKDRGKFYLKVTDDGEGIPRNDEGEPDFKYVATHICDSVKRQLKKEGASGIQGEFGIGLLSFWTVGEELTMASAGADGRVHQMRMRKGVPEYEVSTRRTLAPIPGTELRVYPLLAGIRQLTEDRIQRYLAAELRDRIRGSGVEIRVIDRTARAQYDVEPREFSGRLLRDLSTSDTPEGEIYLELYLNDSSEEHQVSLCRQGTRVLEDITEIEEFAREPWTSGCFQGLVDVPLLNLTPGTRHGVVRDDSFERLNTALTPVEAQLMQVLAEQQRAEEDRAQRDVLKSVQRALREAMLALPEEDYDWFDVYGIRAGAGRNGRKGAPGRPLAIPEQSGRHSAGEQSDEEADNPDIVAEETRDFFQFPGPLHSVVISPKSCVVPVGRTRRLRTVCRDRGNRLVEANLEFSWQIAQGSGSLDRTDGEFATFAAPDEPGLVILKVIARQGERECEAEAIATVTETLVPELAEDRGPKKGLPDYTYERAPSASWRSRYDAEQNVVVINNGHRDFVYASRQKARKLRYVCRLFNKELVLHNFPGLSAQELLERMVELSMYTEEHLR